MKAQKYTVDLVISFSTQASFFFLLLKLACVFV